MVIVSSYWKNFSFLPFAVFLENHSICAIPHVQYAKRSSQASSGLSFGPQQLTSHPATQCHPNWWSVPSLAWCLHLAQLGPYEDSWEPLQHWKRGLASQTGSLYGIHIPPPLHPPTETTESSLTCLEWICSTLILLFIVQFLSNTWCRCIALVVLILWMCSTAINEATFTWSGQLPPRHYQNPIYSCKVFLGGVPWDITEGRRKSCPYEN